jgi:hypothetical protein
MRNLLPCRSGDAIMSRNKNDSSEEDIKVVCRNKRAFHY